jgi:uncharacterized protein YegP (UPF0339 family)
MKETTPMYFETYHDSDGYWRWRLVAANNRIIAVGEGYHNHTDCLHAVNLVKSSHSAPVYQR